MGPDAMILVFWMLSFKPTFSLSSFSFIKRLFSSFSLSAISVVSSAYLRLLIFLLEILIPAWASSSPAFLMMYSAYKLNKQGDNIYSLDVLLSQLETSLFFHIHYYVWNRWLMRTHSIAVEKKMATHSNILAWRIPWTEKPGGLQSMGSQESDMTEWLSTLALYSSGNYTQCSVVT